MARIGGKRGSLWLRVVAFLVAAILIGIGVNEGIHWWRNVVEPNARVEADFTLLSSSVNATIAALHVRRGDRVEKGQLLVSMDTAVEELDLATLDAELAKMRADRKQVEVELKQFQVEMNDKIATADATIRLQRRELSTLQDRRRIAEANVARNAKLRGKRTISARQLDDANDRLLAITGRIRGLETRIRESEQKLKELKGETGQKAVYLSRLEAIDRVIDKIGVQIAQAKERLADMHILAPIGGLIDDVYVATGVYVEDGDRVVLLHDPNALWLEARVDETDIGHVVPGQKARIEFDAYPFEWVEGEVRSIDAVTLGSMENGGAGKGDPRLAQRIPVIIDLPEMEKVVRPGMRATVNIQIR